MLGRQPRNYLPCPVVIRCSARESWQIFAGPRAAACYRSLALWRLSFSRVADAPNGVGAVVSDKQRAVGRDSKANRASPHVFVVDDESSHEVLVFAGGMSGLMQGNANKFVAHANRPIPGAVLSSKNFALVFRGELFAIIKGQLKRRVMRMHQDVRSDDFVLQLRMFAFVPRILMTTHVPPWPTVKAAFLDVCDVVRNQVVSQAIAFVG